MHTRTIATFAMLGLVLACGGGEPTDGRDGRESVTATPDAADARRGSVTVGRIEATLGDEARVWYALTMERDEKPTATSVYQTRTVGPRTAHSLSLGGHVEETVSADGSLRIHIATVEDLGSCPCTLEGQTIEYVIRLPNDRWEARDGTVGLDTFRPVGPGAYEAHGSFSGTLGRAGIDAPDSLRVEGTFAIERVLVVGS